MTSSNTPKPEKKKNTKKSEISKTEKKKTKNAEIPKTDGKTKNREISQEENKKNIKKAKLSNGPSKQRDEGSKKGVAAEGNGEEAKMSVFPMNRIRTMIKGEDPDMRVSQEALFATNNAVEKFLEQFTQDAYAFCAQDCKKCLSYDHLGDVLSISEFSDIRNWVASIV